MAASVDPEKDPRGFALSPAAARSGLVRCRISRDTRTGGRGRNNPVYFLHLERDGGRRTFLLAARKRNRSTTSNYAVSCDAANLSRYGPGYMGKVRSNFLGTAFTVFDVAGASSAGEQQQQRTTLELAGITYETNVLGFQGPRKMTVVLPEVTSGGARTEVRSADRSSSEGSADGADGVLVERLRRRDLAGLVELHNKTPVWNADTQQHVLNFQGRVNRTSVKNFQLVRDSDLDDIVMQFGRISEDTFTMDFAYPMCPLQAFGIALSSFDRKLACE